MHCDNARENKKLEENVMLMDRALSLVYSNWYTSTECICGNGISMIIGRARARAMMNFAGSQQVKEDNYRVRQLIKLPCLIIFWSMNRIVHHNTLCSMDRMQNMPSI